MQDPSLLAICLRHAHIVSWTSSTSDERELFPMWLRCHRCGQIVVVEYPDGAGAEKDRP